MNDPRIAPSLLAADFARLAEEIDRVEQGGADLLHLDVMDGHFVPNISFGLPIVASVRKVTDLELDTHLHLAPRLAWQGQQHFLFDNQPHRSLLSKPDIGVRDFITGAEQLVIIEFPEPPGQQALGFFSARLFRRQSVDDKYQAAVPLRCRRGQTVTGFQGVAGFQPVGGNIPVQKRVPVNLADRVVGKFRFAVIGIKGREIPDRPLGQQGQIPGRR